MLEIFSAEIILKVLVIWAIFLITYKLVLGKLKGVPELKEYISVVRQAFGMFGGLIAFLITLNVFGIKGSWESALTVSGIMGLVIAFSVKDWISNTFYGMMLARSEDFNVGMEVEADGGKGTVLEIGAIYVKIKSEDGVTVVPNSKIYRGGWKIKGKQG